MSINAGQEASLSTAAARYIHLSAPALVVLTITNIIRCILTAQLDILPCTGELNKQSMQHDAMPAPPTVCDMNCIVQASLPVALLSEIVFIRTFCPRNIKLGLRTGLSIVTTLLTPLFNWLLIYHWDLRLDGAAWANVAEACVYFLLLSGYFLWRESRLRQKGQHTFQSW